jgi:hypothetical protein
MRKAILLFFVVLVLSTGSVSPCEGKDKENKNQDEHEVLKNLIISKAWEKLPALFAQGDESYLSLKDYFSSSESIKFAAAAGAAALTYNAKFNDRGEVGVITFENVKGKYARLKIGNQIRPLYFIEKFREYKPLHAVDTPLTLTMGDAVIRFKQGTFYQTLPFNFLLLFDGQWEFSIKPDDEEERLTLERKFKTDSFAASSQQGIFILRKGDEDKNSDFRRQLSLLGEAGEFDVSLLKNKSLGIADFFDLYNGRYGIKIRQFDQYWYLPFPRDAGLTLFPKEKHSFYIYSYRRDSSPDTQLIASDESIILLSYNRDKGLKLTLGPVDTGKDSVEKIRLNLFYNPTDNFISGTAVISFQAPSTLHTLSLAPGLNITGYLNPGPDKVAKGLNVFRKKEKYYLLGPGTDKLSLYFRGHIEPSFENREFLKTWDQNKDLLRSHDAFYFLSRTRNFYPNPGEQFSGTDVKISLPEGLNCLTSGSLVEKSFKGRNVIRYTGSRAKGISLVCGDFAFIRQLDSKIPVNIYSSKTFKYSVYLDLSEIKQAVDFFARAFGSTHLPAFNVLLKRGAYEGGVSSTGFVIINIDPSRGRIPVGPIYLSSTVKTRILSPILIRDIIEDHVLHELAHQWWGGVISWKTYNDVWLTEGLAHFSVLYYLKNHLSGKKFNRIVKKLKRWIYHYSEAGPIIYGTRIHMLEKEYEAYQGVVYDKGAFLFLMLLEWLGEEEFLTRMRAVLEKFAYQNVSSMQFIRQFSGEDEVLLKFFKTWVYSRKIPRIRFSAGANDNNKKQFKVIVRQLNTDFVFPLKVKVVTRGRTFYKTLVIKEKEQSFIFTEKRPIKSVKPVDFVTPVRVE